MNPIDAPSQPRSAMRDEDVQREFGILAPSSRLSSILAAFAEGPLRIWVARRLSPGQVNMFQLTARVLCRGIALAACALVGAPTGSAAPLGPSWTDRALASLTPPSDAELAAARARLRAALGEVHEHLKRLPEGASLSDALQLDALTMELERPHGDPLLRERVLSALRVKRPGELTALLDSLRTAWEDWTALRTLDEASLASARSSAQRLGDWDPALPMSLETEQALRADFAVLAKTRRGVPQLAEFRAVASQPNQRVVVSAQYLQQIAGRKFSVPIDVRQRRDGTRVTATGTLPISTRLQLPENLQSATLRLLVEAEGPVALAAHKDRIHLCAKSQLCLDGVQDYVLTANGVQHDDPRLKLASRTRLTGVNADLRLGERLAERFIARAAAKRLPEADRRATAAAKPMIAARVNDECDDIALRINGLFQALYLTPFAAEDIDTASAFQSSPAGVTWNATYARHDQLGALGPPPESRVPLEDLSYLISIHESAINNLAEQLAGTWLDEATYWIMLNEEFKLQSPEVEAMPPGRLATAVHFAEQSPLVMHVDDRTIHIALTLDQWTLDGQPPPSSSNVQVEATYRVEPGGDGMRLIRNGEVKTSPAADDSLNKILSKYLPSELHPRRKFQNAGVPRRLMVRELNLDDGWLVIGTGPVLESHIANEPREVAR